MVSRRGTITQSIFKSYSPNRAQVSRQQPSSQIWVFPSVLSSRITSHEICDLSLSQDASQWLEFPNLHINTYINLHIICIYTTYEVEMSYKEVYYWYVVCDCLEISAGLFQCEIVLFLDEHSLAEMGWPQQLSPITVASFPLQTIKYAQSLRGLNKPWEDKSRR